MRRLLGDHRDRLDGGRAGADDADAPASEADAVMGPSAGVIPGAGEAIEAVERGLVDRREAAGRHDAIGRGQPRAAAGRDRPVSGRFVEDRGLDGGVEPDLPAKIEAVRDMLEIAQNLRLGGEALGPPPFLLEFLRELVGIFDAVGIAAGARIAVPVPRASHPAAGLEHSHREPHPAQPVQHVEPGEPGADDDRIDIACGPAPRGRARGRHGPGRARHEPAARPRPSAPASRRSSPRRPRSGARSDRRSGGRPA